MNFFKKLFLSFTSTKAYRYFSTEPFGKAFRFLIVVTLIFAPAAMAGGLLDFNRGINQAAGVFENSPMDFSLENGKLTVNIEMPHIFESDGEIAIIDTTGATDESVLDGYTKAIFIGADKAVIKDGDEVIDFSYQVLPNMSLNSRIFSTIFRALKWFIPVVLIIGFVVTLVLRLVQALLVAIVGIIIASVLRTGLGFGNVMSMAIYSLTLPSMVGILRVYLPFTIPNLYFNMLYFTIAAIFMVLGLIHIAKTKETEEQTA